MWQIYYRVQPSIGFSGSVMLADTLGHGGSWARLCGTDLAMIPKMSKPSPKLYPCSKGRMKVPMITHFVLRQCWRRFPAMMNHGYEICLCGDCTHIWLHRSTCRTLPCSIEQSSWERELMWQYSYLDDQELVGVAVPNRRQRLQG